MIAIAAMHRRRAACCIRFSLNYRSTNIICNFSTHSDKNSSKDKEVGKERIFTLPNIITMSRILASPFLAYAIAHDMKGVALGGCALVAFSDWLDGYIARRFNQSSVLGGFLDPLADKVVIGALTAGLCYKGLLPVPLCAIIISRDLLLVAGSFIVRYREIPPGAPFFDTTYSATFSITPSAFGKLNTVVQFSLLSLTLCNFATGAPPVTMLEPLWYITAASTMGSGVDYLFGTGLTRLAKSGVGRGHTPTSTSTSSVDITKSTEETDKLNK